MPVYVIFKDNEDEVWTLSTLRLPPESARYERKVYEAPLLENALEAIRRAHNGQPVSLKEYDYAERRVHPLEPYKQPPSQADMAERSGGTTCRPDNGGEESG